MRVRTILNRVHPIKSFRYTSVRLATDSAGEPRLEAFVAPRKGSRPRCGNCGKLGPCYDHVDTRWFLFVPLWAIAVYLVYTPRRVNCKACGVRVELMPWVNGKHQTTHAMNWFLASWAKVLSWKETARRFGTSPHVVFSAVEAAVIWGRAHMNLDGIRSIGVDEIAWRIGQRYLTVVYQIDHHQKRLLWVAENRTAKAFEGFFDWLDERRPGEAHTDLPRSAAIAFVASDMWKAFLRVVRERASSAVHVLDRFHIAQMLSKAIDEVRREETRSLRDRGLRPYLSKTRFILLKRAANLTSNQRATLADLMKVNLKSTRAYLLKERLLPFWSYKSPYWGGRYLDGWITEALRSRLEPVKRVARSLRNHRPLILNWLRARAQNAFAAGATEGLNNKAKLSSKMAYGFRTRKHAEIALLHRLGSLPEPQWLAHRFVR
jgi:transposase